MSTSTGIGAEGGVEAAVQEGWHLLTYANGDVAIVNFQNGRFKWGNVTAPTASPTSDSWLGAKVSDIGSAGVSDTNAGVEAYYKLWGDALSHVSSDKVKTTLISELDHGQLGLHDHAVLIGSNAQPKGGTSKQAGGATGSEATVDTSVDPAGNVNVPSIGSLFGVFASQSFWKGIGLVLAGALILIFAGLEFYRMTG